MPALTFRVCGGKIDKEASERRIGRQALEEERRRP